MYWIPKVVAAVPLLESPLTLDICRQKLPLRFDRFECMRSMPVWVAIFPKDTHTQTLTTQNTTTIVSPSHSHKIS